MLPSYLRLDLRSLPDYFQTAKTRRGEYFLLKNRLESADPVSQSLSSQPSNSPVVYTRVALVVPKRFGGAAERVKIKRWMRNAVVTLSKQQPQLFALPYSLVLVVSKLPSDYQHVEQDIERLLKTLPG